MIPRKQCPTLLPDIIHCDLGLWQLVLLHKHHGQLILDLENLSFGIACAGPVSSCPFSVNLESPNMGEPLIYCCCIIVLAIFHQVCSFFHLVELQAVVSAIDLLL